MLYTCMKYMYTTFSNMWKNLQYNADQQYITTAQCVIIVDIQEYKTLVKKTGYHWFWNHGFSQKMSGNHTFAK